MKGQPVIAYVLADEEHSAAAQRACIATFVASRGLEVVRWVEESGDTAPTTGLLFGIAKAPGAAGLVVYDVDRVARRNVDLADLLDVLGSRPLMLARTGVTTQTAAERFVVRTMVMMLQYQAELREEQAAKETA